MGRTFFGNLVNLSRMDLIYLKELEGGEARVIAERRLSFGDEEGFPEYSEYHLTDGIPYEEAKRYLENLLVKLNENVNKS